MFRIGLISLLTIIHFNIYSQSITKLLDSAQYYIFSDYKKSISFSDSAYKIATKQKNDTQRANAILKIGIASYLSGEHDVAISKYLEAEKIFSNLNYIKGITATYNELGILYSKQNKIAEAKSILKKSIFINKDKIEIRNYATSHNNLGLVYLKGNVLDSAEYFFNIALENYKIIKDSLGISYALDYLSSINISNKNYSLAEQYLQESMQIKHQLNDKTGIAIAVNNIGELYLAKGDFSTALKYFKAARDSAHQLNFMDLEANTFLMQSIAYQNLNDYKNAYLSIQNYNELIKKILDDKRLKNIEEFKTKYDTEKKEKEIIQQKLKINNRNIIAVILFSLLLLAFFLFYLFYNRYKLKQERKLQEELIKEEEKRGKAIVESEENERQRLARELHDGVGQLLTATKLNLSTLSGFNNEAENNKLKNSLDILDDSIKEIRNISHNMAPDVLLKFGLQKAVESFISKINQAKKIEISFECNSLEEHKLDNTSKLMLYRIIQESVNNVMKYAEATHLSIQISADETELSLMIEDNGKGFDVASTLSKNGIGLKNIQLRTDYLKGKLEIDSSPKNGTTIIIEIPLS